MPTLLTFILGLAGVICLWLGKASWPNLKLPGMVLAAASVLMAIFSVVHTPETKAPPEVHRHSGNFGRAVGEYLARTLPPASRVGVLFPHREMELNRRLDAAFIRGMTGALGEEAPIVLTPPQDLLHDVPDDVFMPDMGIWHTPLADWLGANAGDVDAIVSFIGYPLNATTAPDSGLPPFYIVENTVYPYYIEHLAQDVIHAVVAPLAEEALHMGAAPLGNHHVIFTSND